MFNMKAFAAVLMSTLLVDGAMAAEFNSGKADSVNAPAETTVTAPAPSASVQADAEFSSDSPAMRFKNEMAPETVKLMSKSTEEYIAPSAPPKKRNVDPYAPLTLAHDWVTAMEMNVGPNPNDVYIQIGSYEQETNIRSISDVRALGIAIAQMNAKAAIAKHLNTKVTASTRATLPPNTPLLTEYDKEKRDLEDKLEDLLAEYEDAVRAVDKEKAKQVAGINTDDLYVAGIAATLGKYGVDLDIPGLKAESKQKIEELQNQLKSLEGKLEEVKKTTEKIAGQISEENSSEVEVLAKMVVSGAVTVKSWERFDDATSKYQVAVVVVHSPSQERFIRCLLGTDGSPLKLKPTGTEGMSLREYINEMDWSSVAGSRWFVDCDGTPHLFGIGIEDLRNKKSTTIKRAAAIAEGDALANLSFALQADVKFQLEAKRKVQSVLDKKGDTKSLSVSSVMQDVTQDTDLRLVGVSTVFENVCSSPITTRDAYVKVVHINPLSMREALKKLNRELYTARELGKKQQETKGFIDQGMATVKEARKDRESYERGAEKAREKAAQQARAAEQKLGEPVRANRSESSSYNDARMRKGTFSGGAADNFTF